MKKEEYDILNLINEGRSINEIAGLLSLSCQEVYEVLRRFKNHGYHLLHHFYPNGQMHSTMNNEDKTFNHKIITSSKKDELELLVISDLHFGSIYENKEYLNVIYDYCTKEGLHLLINLGDFVEGEVNLKNIIVPPYKQIEHALSNHPQSNDILELLLLGNHDYSLLTNYHIDVIKEILTSRSDIIPLGYAEKEIDIKNDSIVLRHPTWEFEKGTYCHKLILSGHGHQARIHMDSANTVVYLPSLSDLNLNKSHFPGALRLKLKMRCGLIEYIVLEELTIVNHKMYTTNDINLFVGMNKSFRNNAKVYNEGEYVKVKKKV